MNLNHEHTGVSKGMTWAVAALVVWLCLHQLALAVDPLSYPRVHRMAGGASEVFANAYIIEGERGGRNAQRDFHGESRRNETHESSTDPDAQQFRKGRGKEARLCYMGHALMENRHGLVVDAWVTQVTGTAERDSAVAMVGERPGTHRITVGRTRATILAGPSPSCGD